jgi:hypothetical protein
VRKIRAANVEQDGILSHKKRPELPISYLVCRAEAFVAKGEISTFVTRTSFVPVLRKPMTSLIRRKPHDYLAISMEAERVLFAGCAAGNTPGYSRAGLSRQGTRRRHGGKRRGSGQRQSDFTEQRPGYIGREVQYGFKLSF